MMMKPLLSHYQTEAVENMLADYQYILNVPDPIDEDDEHTLMGIVQKLLTPSLKTNTEGVETFALTSLKNIPKNREGESISVYGIQKDSKYVSAELFEDGVTNFIEIGPGHTLAGFVKKVARDMGITEFTVTAIETSEDIAKLCAEA